VKSRTVLLLLATCLAVACSPAVTPAIATPTPTPAPPLPRSMKGYELYSWPANGQWHFTLITGTNRLKTVEEITTGEDLLTADGWVRIHVQGVDAIQAVLGRIPPGEWVFWIGQGWLARVQGAEGDITLPPQETVAAIQSVCGQLGITLQVSE
jgi:hypothetical protein